MKLLKPSLVFLFGFFAFLFFTNPVSAQTVYPATIDELGVDINPEQTEADVVARGERGCLQPCTPRIPYTFDAIVYGWVEKIDDPKSIIIEPEDPRMGAQHYPQNGPYTWAYTRNNVDISSFPNGTYRFCVGVNGNATSGLVPGDPRVPPDEDCAPNFTINNRPDPADFTVLCTPNTQIITAGNSISYNLISSPLNGFSSPITYSVSVIDPSTPNPPALSFINNGQVPPAVTTVLVTTADSTTPGVYGLFFNATGNGITHSCNVYLTVNPSPPTADIKANGSDGPVSVAFNGSATVSWTSTESTSCNVAPVSWTGTVGSQNVSNITADRTYSLTCSGPGGTATDTVSVTVGAPPAPFADIKCNSVNGPCTIPYNTSAVISWTSTNATSCTVNPGGFPGTSNFGILTGNLTANRTYTQTCTGPGGSASDTVTVNVTSPLPTADIRANGSNGPISVTSGNTAFITWTSTNATSCTVAPLGGSGTTGSDATAAITTPQTYTLSCSGPGGNVTDTVQINILPSQDFSLSCTPFTQTVTKGGTTAFSLLTNQINGFSGTVNVGLASITPSSSLPNIIFVNNDQEAPGVSTALVLTSASTIAQTYNVNFFGASGPLNHTCSGGAVQLIVVEPPPPTPDLSTSDKDIVSLNTKPNPNQPCFGGSEAPQGAHYKTGDRVTFSINICNSGSGSIGSLSVVDQLANLISPTNFIYTGCSGTQSVAGNQITFNIAGSIASGDICSIKFTAELNKQDSTSDSCYYFSNTAEIFSAGVSKRKLVTPFYLTCATGTAPSQYEVAP